MHITKMTKMCSVDSYRSFIFKKDQEKQSEKFDCRVHQIKKCKKRQDSFRVCSFYIYSKAHTENRGSIQGKVEVWCQYQSNIIRDEKYVDNNRHIFHLLWRLLWKISIGKYCLKLYDKKTSSKWFCLFCQKIIAMSAYSVVFGRCLKWNHLSCTFLKKLPKVDIAILNLKNKIRIYLHLKNLQSSCEKNTHYYN